MKEDKYKEYKNFTPFRCKACGNIIINDIHDSLCEDCLGDTFASDEVNEEDFYIVEEIFYN